MAQNSKQFCSYNSEGQKLKIKMSVGLVGNAMRVCEGIRPRLSLSQLLAAAENRWLQLCDSSPLPSPSHGLLLSQPPLSLLLRILIIGLVLPLNSSMIQSEDPYHN